jgi:hypothetical protein
MHESRRPRELGTACPGGSHSATSKRFTSSFTASSSVHLSLPDTPLIGLISGGCRGRRDSESQRKGDDNPERVLLLVRRPPAPGSGPSPPGASGIPLGAPGNSVSRNNRGLPPDKETPIPQKLLPGESAALLPRPGFRARGKGLRPESYPEGAPGLASEVPAALS